MKKPLLIIGLGTYSILLILAILLYKERIVILDTSLQLSEMIAKNGFAIQVNRFGAALTQAFPLIGIKLHLSLQSITLLYSISFIMLYLGCFLIILLVLKNEALALVLLLFNTIMVRHSFFWIQCELIQGVALCLLSFALLHYYIRIPSRSYWLMGLLGVMFITLTYMHPSLMFVSLFLFVISFIEFKKNYRLILGFLIFYALNVLVKTFFLNNWYDQSALSNLANLSKYYPNYLSLPTNKQFLTYLLKDYYLLVIPALLSFWYCLQQKRYLLFATCLFFSLGYLFMVNIIFVDSRFQFYLESQYIPLVCFLSFPFVMGIRDGFYSKPFAITLVNIMILVSTWGILNTSKFYKARLSCIERIYKSYPDKSILASKLLDENLLYYEWGLPYETWLLSTISEGKSKSMLSTEFKEKTLKQQLNPKVWIGSFTEYNYDSLNKNYFIMDSTLLYKEIDN